VVTIVGMLQRCLVSSPKFVCFDIERCPPAKSVTAEGDDQVVGCYASMATVPVREGMGVRQSVMKSDREFITFKGLAVYPHSGIGHQVPDCLRDMGRSDTDIGLPVTVRPGPLPDLVEHALMELP